MTFYKSSSKRKLCKNASMYIAIQVRIQKIDIDLNIMGIMHTNIQCILMLLNYCSVPEIFVAIIAVDNLHIVDI